MPEAKNLRDEEKVPIVPPLKVIEHKTINKRFGWWSAVVLLESYGRKQVCFYLWQKKPEGGWKRKQKFAIHNQQDWSLIQDAVGGMIETLT
ncbi:MAG: hypothetical protein A3I73_04795 [Omnitrophica bacterium RIFCSPLOWO2_02_FULL_45_16]|nr:MAG: hypothetical protein A3C51_02305 [Omnitrophica bacterium RIFCSPHIGHO2_02_FULL_46_20]OGW94227.1 MAG: hypothetical protein A3G36_04510 [Omnitrophica bacterium RIFCSPLOWO2_12_FULL_45_13]OGW94771.1 MAG: hypothetical protein A3K16_03445 [Omnitrophica bacterium RIFCSPLOWO2_01_FULL_45_24]OGX01031.1 MAG: hypothetical protein A3I73_04795 [Omnitrophica bacterium RIFCSPLOWO2_02_FULL_45_16]